MAVKSGCQLRRLVQTIQPSRQKPFIFNAGGGTRTRTAPSGQRILSPLRLPFRHPGAIIRMIVDSQRRFNRKVRSCGIVILSGGRRIYDCVERFSQRGELVVADTATACDSPGASRFGLLIVSQLSSFKA